MAKSSTTTPATECISTWYQDSVAATFAVPVDHWFVGSFTARVTEDEFGALVDRFQIYGGPTISGPVVRKIMLWVYETRMREWTLQRAIRGEWWVTGADEKFLHVRGLDVDLSTIPYDEYLNTDHWEQVRASALERADHRCQLCNDTSALQVHHRTYERRGREEPADVIVLCKTCHERFHDVKNGRATRMPVKA